MGKQLPGFEIGRTMTPREILLSQVGLVTIPIVVDAPRTIDGLNAVTNEIRAGHLMGRITATGKWTNAKHTFTEGTGVATADVVVDNAIAFKAGDVIAVGLDTGLTILSVDYSTNTITLTTTITWANDEQVVAEDGSEIARGILFDWVKLRDSRNENDVDQGARLLIGGAVVSELILGDLIQILNRDKDLTDRFFLRNIIFSHEHGYPSP